MSPVLQQQEVVPAEYLRGLRALIVDDNSTNRRILQHQLVRWGMRVESASDGTDALAMLKVSCDSGDPYKLVLLDAQMPHMSGFEVAAMIQAEPRLQGSAVMMLSSIDLMADSAQSRRLDIRRYLVKPVTEADLRSAVLQIISPGSKLSEVPRAKPLAAGSATRAFSWPRTTRLINAWPSACWKSAATRSGARGDGFEALTLLDKESFEVVLMDVHMPRMDGLDCTRAIRARESNNNGNTRVLIIAMTANAMESDKEICLSAAMDGYVSKQIRWDRLNRSSERADWNRADHLLSVLPGHPRSALRLGGGM